LAKLLEGGIPKELFDHCGKLFKYNLQLKLNASELSRPLELLKSLKRNKHFAILQQKDNHTQMVAKLLPKLPMHPTELERELKEANPDLEKSHHNFPLDIAEL
jgi:hypothetical protein